MTSRPRVALVVSNAGKVFADVRTGGLGGVEVQYGLIARHLAGVADVVLVGAGAGDADPPPGVSVVTLGGVRGSLQAWDLALAQADADVYVQSAAGLATYAVARFCRRKGRHFVYHWASDADADGRLVVGVVERRLFLRGRRRAATQLVQTAGQQRLLPPRERRRSVLFPNLLDDRVEWPIASGSAILWVGALKAKAKRPELLLDVAAALPGRQFLLVGDLRGDDEYQRALRARIASLPNLEWAGFVDRLGMPAAYARAGLLLNTSSTEGFPNTFLEAAACGVPVVATSVDPSEVLGPGTGRFVQADVAAIAQAIEAMEPAGVREQARRACLAAAAAHRADKLMPRLLAALGLPRDAP
jgi:glycosyltransferase involved in cell wall biosynthesis